MLCMYMCQPLRSCSAVNICMCVLDDWFWKANEIPPPKKKKNCSCLDFRRALLTQALRNMRNWFYGSASPPRWASGFLLIREDGARVHFISLLFFLIKTYFNLWIKSVSFTELFFTVQSHTLTAPHPSGAFGTRRRCFATGECVSVH